MYYDGAFISAVFRWEGGACQRPNTIFIFIFVSNAGSGGKIIAMTSSKYAVYILVIYGVGVAMGGK